MKQDFAFVRAVVHETEEWKEDRNGEPDMEENDYLVHLKIDIYAVAEEKDRLVQKNQIGSICGTLLLGEQALDDGLDPERILQESQTFQHALRVSAYNRTIKNYNIFFLKEFTLSEDSLRKVWVMKNAMDGMAYGIFKQIHVCPGVLCYVSDRNCGADPEEELKAMEQNQERSWRYTVWTEPGRKNLADWGFEEIGHTSVFLKST